MVENGECLYVVDETLVTSQITYSLTYLLTSFPKQSLKVKMQSRVARSKTFPCKWAVLHPKRFNFTSSTHLSDRIPERYNINNDINSSETRKRITQIEKHLTGKPFDDLENFTIPEKIDEDFTETVESINLDVIPSPFVHFEPYAALNILLHDETHPKEMSKYDYFIRGKWENSKFDDKVDSILNWNKKYNQKYKPINNIGELSNIKLPNDLKTAILNTLDNNEVDFDFKTSLDNLSKLFPKYSFENLTVLYIKTIPEFSSEKQEILIHSINEFFPQNILHFHDQTLEIICDNLITFKQIKSVNTIIRAYSEFSHSESDFLNVTSKSFCQRYLKGLLEFNNVQMARNVMNSILKSGYVPNFQIITDYFKIVSVACSNANAPKDKIEVLFNLFTKPLKSVLLIEGMMNEVIISSISKFMRLALLPDFISYLKLSPDYSKINEIPDIIIDRLSTSEIFKTQNENTRIINLTTILHLLDADTRQLSSITKKKIINLYADLHCPLAVLKWSKTLNEPLDQSEKLKILETLKGNTNSINSKFDISNKL